MPQPELNWTLLNGALASLILGEKQAYLDLLKQIQKNGLYSADPAEHDLANFFLEVSRTLLEKRRISASIRTLYDKPQETFALLLFAMWDWEGKSAFSDAGTLLETFKMNVPESAWETAYKPLAEKYLADWNLLKPVESELEKTNSPEAATALFKTLKAVRSQLQTGTKINERIDEIEQRLLEKGAKP
jgi:hypothetical protein